MGDNFRKLDRIFIQLHYDEILEDLSCFIDEADFWDFCFDRFTIR